MLCVWRLFYQCVPVVVVVVFVFIIVIHVVATQFNIIPFYSGFACVCVCVFGVGECLCECESWSDLFCKLWIRLLFHFFFYIITSKNCNTKEGKEKEIAELESMKSKITPDTPHQYVDSKFKCEFFAVQFICLNFDYVCTIFCCCVIELETLSASGHSAAFIVFIVRFFLLLLQHHVNNDKKNT